jgi:hypothetical protein
VRIRASSGGGSEQVASSSVASRARTSFTSRGGAWWVRA